MSITFTPWRANGGVVLDARGYMVADCDSTNDQKGAAEKAKFIAAASRLVPELKALDIAEVNALLAKYGVDA